MAVKIDTFRLPNQWGSETDDDQNSPRLYLKNSINLDLPISGGWGYSEEDCVVIDMNDPTVDQDKTFDGTKVESVFVEKRIYAELIVFRSPDNRFSGIEWTKTRQRVEEINEKKFDVLDYSVTAFSDEDWDFLKREWEENGAFLDDEKGRARHLENRNKLMCFYKTQYWFDITSFHGKQNAIFVNEWELTRRKLKSRYDAAVKKDRT